MNSSFYVQPTNRGRGKSTTWAERCAILDWLELPPGDNLKIILGTSTSDLRMVTAGHKVNKKTAVEKIDFPLDQMSLF